MAIRKISGTEHKKLPEKSKIDKGKLGGREYSLHPASSLKKFNPIKIFGKANLQKAEKHQIKKVKPKFSKETAAVQAFSVKYIKKIAKAA